MVRCGATRHLVAALATTICSYARLGLLAMTATYENLGVQFLYPENWQITDEDPLAWPRTVSLQSPGGGFWSLMVYRPDQDPEELTAEVLETMRQEYDGLESAEVSECFEQANTWGYEMQFCCLDFLVSARVLAVRVEDQTLLMIWQAEDREFQQMEPVFRAITTSLLRADG